ncbi:MAG TPA: hypothetical protein VLB49_16560 [Gemmatimonadales bacterium]|nr:hypothetical protein [Gemmatimonadales bacterium]
MRPTPLAVQPRVLQGLAAVGLALALTTCAREAAGPRHAAFSVSPVLPAGLSLAAFNLTVDNVRLIVVRPPTDTVVDQTFAFPANQSSLPISADVPLEQSPETFQVTIQLLSGTTLLFAGTQSLAVTEGTSTTPAQIPVTYNGPGQNIATLTIGPLDSVLTQGGTLQFRLTAKDAQGVDVPTFYASWTTSDTNVAKVDPAGVLTAPLSRATVNVVARTPNTTAHPNGVADTTSITFAPAATALAIVSGCGQSGLLGTQLPLPIVAKVTAGDGLGVPGVVVTFSAPAGGAVTTPQVVTDAAGLAQTSITLPSSSGPSTFQVSAPGLTTVPCAQSAFGTAAKVAFVAQPSAALAGTIIAPPVVVAAQDAQGTLVPTFTGNVTIALGLNPGSGTLSGNVTVAAIGGLATFSDLSIDKAGVGYTLAAGAPGLIGATSTAFTIGAGTATQLAFTVQPVTTASGAAITPAVVVTAQDVLGNPVPGFTGTVAMTINTGPVGAVLSGTLSTAAVAGSATFGNLILDKAGTYTLRAQAGGVTAVNSNSFDVTVGATRQLVFTTQPSATVTAGSAIAPAVVVAVQDLQGNTDATFNNSVTISFGVNAGGGVLSGTSVVPATAGVATFANLIIDKSGIGYTLQATASGVTTGTSTPFTVNPGTAARLAFLVPPTTVGVNAPITPDVVVEIQDMLGNLVTSAANQVDLRIGVNPGNATLGGTAIRTAVNGLATFPNLTLNQPGTGYTLVAGSGSLGSATSPAFDVLPGATQFLVQVNPITVVAGGTVDVTVTAQDGLGNTVPGYRGTVHFVTSDPQGTVPADYTFIAADNGTHTFKPGATLKTASSSQFVDVIDVVDSRIFGFGSVEVTPDVPNKLAYIQQPTQVVQRLTIVPAVTVAVEDQFGNVVTGAANTVSLAIGANPGSGSLTGGAGVDAVGGIATFGGLSIDQPGNGYTLVAAAGALTGVTSNAFNVLPTGSLITWLGDFDSDWNQPLNWDTGKVPTSSDNVRISSGLNLPALSTDVTVQGLTVDPGATITTGGFKITVGRSLDTGSGILGTGTVTLAGSGWTVTGFVEGDLAVSGVYTVSTTLSVVNNLDLIGTGSLDLGLGGDVVVGGNLTTSASATITMKDGGALSVTGNANFGGGSEAGRLTNGTLQLVGDFNQTGDPESFAADSAFFTQFVSANPQTITFAKPGFGAGNSHFGALQVVNNAAGVTLGSAVFANGQFSGFGGGGTLAKILGNSHTLTAKGLFSDSLLIDNMPLVVAADTVQPLFFNHVVFQNFSPSAIQLDISRVNGSATFTGLQFLGTPPTPGFHLRANDPVVGNGAFSVILVTPLPTGASGAARFTTTGEAQITWP